MNQRMIHSPVPARVHRAGYAQRVYPEEYLKLVPALERTDPLADRCVQFYGDDVRTLNRDLGIGREPSARESLPAPLRELFESVAHAPPYFDDEVSRHGGDVLFRAGFWSGISLGVKCLIHGYAAPAGNKPLALSGRLTGAATQRRLGETARFVHGVCSPGSMLPGGEGWLMTLRVRLMHARVRSLVLRSGRWDVEAWSAPINQHDMVATILLFSTVLLDALHRLGQRPSDEEEERYVRLWRWIGEVIGVEPELLGDSPAAARRAQFFIRDTQGPPDDDSRRMTRSLLEGPIEAAQTPAELRRARRFCAISNALCRFLLDPTMANDLDVRRGQLDALLPMIVRTVSRTDAMLNRRNPSRQLERGRSHWDKTIEMGVGLHWQAFPVPDSLRAR